ncbi:hypothetical protein [Aeromonas salmonicida]
MEPNDLERLIHESLEQLGWKADAHEMAKKVQRLHYGLPLEDEFSVLCGWLGKCKLIHKLDQQQFPKSSRLAFQVPDLLAVFEYNGKNVTVLIEVKSSNKNVLSFKPEYKEKLKRYSSLLNIPVLIAWKNKWGIWVLVTLEDFKKSNSNFNLAFENALKNNLLGILAGDFSYSLGVGAGVHVSFNKQELIESKTDNSGDTTENWKMVIDDVYFSTYEGEKTRDLSFIAQQVFFSWDLTEEETHTDTHVTLHNTCKEQSMVFAHMALTRVLNFHSSLQDKSIQWRGILGGGGNIASISNFRSGILENMKKKIVHHVLDQIPCSMPDFLK